MKQRQKYVTEVLYVQEEVTPFYNLLHKMGHYFLDIQYLYIMHNTMVEIGGTGDYCGEKIKN